MNRRRPSSVGCSSLSPWSTSRRLSWSSSEPGELAGRLFRRLRPVADGGDLAGGVRALLEQDAEAVVVQDRRLDLHGLVVLAAGVGPDDDEAGLLADRAGDLAAALLDRRGGLVAAVVAQRAGHDDGDAGERARSGALPLVGHPHPGGAPLLDDLAVPVHGEPVADRRGDGGTDAVGGRELLLGRLGDPVERAEVARERLRRGG